MRRDSHNLGTSLLPSNVHVLLICGFELHVVLKFEATGSYVVNFQKTRVASHPRFLLARSKILVVQQQQRLRPRPRRASRATESRLNRKPVSNWRALFLHSVIISGSPTETLDLGFETSSSFTN